MGENGAEFVEGAGSAHAGGVGFDAELPGDLGVGFVLVKAEEDERSERVRFQRASFEHTQTAKLVSDLESQLVLANKRLFECEKFQSETDSQLVKDKAELATAVARLQSFVERLSNAEKTKDDEIAQLRQKRRALEKELDDLSLELENVRQKASCVAKCERKS